MNIVEAYIKFNKQLVIFVSGISGCGKTALAKNISKDFKLPLIDQFDYYKKDYDVKSVLSDETELINWDSDDAMDWTKLNEDIEKQKTTGIIVTGFALTNKITVKPDYHIHVSMSKQNCIERRQEFLKKYQDKYPTDFKLVGTPTEKLKMNKFTYPYYLGILKESTITKFLNANELNDDGIYDNAFTVLIKFIEDAVYKDRELARSRNLHRNSISDSINKINSISDSINKTESDANDESSLTSTMSTDSSIESSQYYNKLGINEDDYIINQYI
jgi:hypothetical protein